MLVEFLDRLTTGGQNNFRRTIQSPIKKHFYSFLASQTISPKKIIHSLRLLYLLGLLTSVATAHADRETIPLRADWRFIKEDAGIFATSESWEKITIPHTWNALDAQDGPAEISDKQESAAEAAAATARSLKAKKAANGDEKLNPHMKRGLYEGACWYERTIDIPAEWEGKKRVFIRFEAASSVAKTYINKTLLGEHRGAFTAFCYELTDYLKYGSKNELRLQVDNTRREDVPPQFGDFNLDGGIYRPAQLIVTDDVCVSPLDYASSGIYLTTKSLENAKAVVEVRSIISNGEKLEPASKSKNTTPGEETGIKSEKRESRPAPVHVTILTEIKDAAGQTVAKNSTEKEIPSEESVSVTQLLTITAPHCWNGRQDPYLYTATVRVQRGDEIVDQVTQSLGLRTVAITQEQGFLLNGKPYPVHGVSRHQDIRNKGWAISPEDEENDARFMKEMGVTAVRNAHYPQSDNWHAINDREGVLLWNELSLINVTRDTRAFWSNSEECLREMIYQLYNHPSVAWWGLFNELGTRPMPPSDEKLAHLQAVVKEIDPNRIVVAASCRSGQSFNLVTEQMAFNHYPGWYHEFSPSAMKAAIEKRSEEVGKRIAISEYGAGANIAHHTEGALVQPTPRGPFHPEEYQAFVHEQDWADMRDNPHLWGTFIWNMFDFAHQGRKEGNIISLNDKGMVTHDRRFKKDAFFFYKANWNPEPMVYITSRRLVFRTQPVTGVKVYSNCQEVELKVNGHSCGMIKPDGLKIARWSDIKLTPGENTIEAIGKSKDKTFTDSCKWDLGQSQNQSIR